MPERPSPAASGGASAAVAWEGPVYGGVGVLATDGTRVACHLCARWCRLPANHVRQAHGLTPAAHRELTGLNAQPDRATLVEAVRAPGQARQFAAHYQLPSIEHVAHVTVACAPEQLIAYYQALVDTGLWYVIVGYGRDDETLRLLAQEGAPHVRVPV